MIPTSSVAVVRFFDTAQGKLRPFHPLDPQCVTVYVCGPTVYGRIHLGNARSAVVFDILYRVLSFFYQKVLYVRNITDVDDKINETARQQGIPIQALTEKTIASFHQDMEALGVLPPTEEPRATEHVPHMIRMMADLVQKGLAYESQGHVLFSTGAFPGYGHLSGMSMEDMEAGARVEVAPYKRDPCDFVLWKPSPQGEIYWDSPWGPGRPGWHIECSAMSTTYLGPTFDIHGGGRDLLFPHHENEHAQTCSVTGFTESARYWLHNGMLLVDGKKMSKSLGNFITMETILQETPAEVVRWALLSSHYRQALDWTPQLLRQSFTCVTQLYQVFRDIPASALETAEEEEGLDQGFIEALCHDMNTPKALRTIRDLIRHVHKAASGEKLMLAKRLWNCGKFLGFLQRPVEAWFQATTMGRKASLSPEEIASAIDQRAKARQAQDYAQADVVRKTLLEKGVIVEDGPEGTTWRWA